MGKSKSFIARKIRELREAHKPPISAYRLSQLTDINKQTIAYIEQGTSIPSFDKVDLIAMALGVSLDEFHDPDLKLPEAEKPGKAGRPPATTAKGTKRK